MDTSFSALSSLFNFYVFPTGRRVFALGQVAAKAKASGHSDLTKHCNAAVAEDRKCLALERKWAGVTAAAKRKVASIQPRPSERVRKLDGLVDRTLTAIRDNAESQRAGAEDDDPIHATVTSFLGEIFPTGVGDVTALPFVEELIAVEDILDKTSKPEVAKVIDELHLGTLFERLAGLTKQYRAALHVPEEPPAMLFDEVRKARVSGEERMLEAVAMILGKHPSSSPKDTTARAELLEPILKQNAAIAVTMKTRAVVTDVNPETGEPSDVPADETTGSVATPKAAPAKNG
ncbi:MAG: hypothetical protein U0441_36475 [Polyangiaceae bacterium]